MRNFDQDDRSGGRSGYKKFAGKKPWGQDRGGGYSSQRPTMHQATCSECGNACEVPFKPTGARPIFCSLCFKKDGDTEYRKPERREFSARPSFDRKTMFTATCAKCKDRCEVPFQPKDGRPVYCSQCFGSDDSKAGANKNSASYDEQFKTLNKKLDSILTFLNPTAAVKVKSEKEKPVEIVEEEKEEEKPVKKVKIITKKITTKKVSAKKKK